MFFNLTASLQCYAQEIFGPVLLCVELDTFDEAITFCNKNPYGFPLPSPLYSHVQLLHLKHSLFLPTGNGACLFTNSGVVRDQSPHFARAHVPALHVQCACRSLNLILHAGSAARKFQFEIESGNVGINVPIPVPLPYFSFTGSKASMFGDLQFYGKTGIQVWHIRRFCFWIFVLSLISLR